MKTIYNAMLVAAAALSASCTEIENGTTDIDSWPTPVKPVTYEYTVTDENMGMYNKADFERVRKSLEDGTAHAKVVEEFNALKNSRYAQINYQPNVLEWVVRGKDDGKHGNAEGRENYAACMNDATAAYQLAMLWHLTADDRYADAAINVLNQWATRNKGRFSTDSNALLLSAQSYTFANAALMLRSYENWSEAEQKVVKDWLVDKWSTYDRGFMDNHNGTCLEHYWSNWDLLAMCSYFSIGELTNNHDMINYVVNLFYRGNGQGLTNGSLVRLCNAFHADPLGSGETLGQNQESGRDQGHSQMSAAVSAQLAQLAYSLYKTNPDKPELDFFAANDNTLLKMAEYVALFNLRAGTDQANTTGEWLIKDAANYPFQKYYYCGGSSQEGPACGCQGAHTHGATHTQIANDGARGNLRPNWEIYYNHYKNEKHLAIGYKYAKMAADKMRPECGTGDERYGFNSGAFDQIGWNTLMMYQGE